MPITPEAAATAEDTDVNTGLATTVTIVTYLAYISTLDARYNDATDEAFPLDKAFHQSDFENDGTWDPDRAFLSCAGCSGDWGDYVADSGELRNSQPSQTTGFPDGTTYESKIHGRFQRVYVPLGGAPQYPVDIIREDIAHITVGQLL